jgi:uncharacterized membrane protein
MTFRIAIFACLFALFLVLPVATVAREPAASAGPDAGNPVVQGVFFFSPTCPHCEYVINEHLPGIFEVAGGEYTLDWDETLPIEDVAFYLMSNGSVQLLLADTSVEAGATMFVEDSERLGIERGGVPRLDIRDDYLVGSADIPAELPGIISTGLAAGGIGWPAVPGIEEAILPFQESGSVALPEPVSGDGDEDQAAVLPAGTDDTPLDKIGRDPVGNGVSIIVLVALLGSLIAVPLLAMRGTLRPGPAWLVPTLVIVGLVVAAYLASIESSGSKAVCGPVGDCNAVQASEYASLFGVPIGVLGMIGYAVLGGLWAMARWGHGKLADWALLGIAVGALVGTLFSTYLTFLEPFVIGATCMWCITSALVMLALLWLTAGAGWAAYQRLRGSAPSSGLPAGERGSAATAAGH